MFQETFSRNLEFDPILTVKNSHDLSTKFFLGYLRTFPKFSLFAWAGHLKCCHEHCAANFTKSKRIQDTGVRILRVYQEKYAYLEMVAAVIFRSWNGRTIIKYQNFAAFLCCSMYSLNSTLEKLRVGPVSVLAKYFYLLFEENKNCKYERKRQDAPKLYLT